MTYNEMAERITSIFPDAIFDEDTNGELIIATGFRVEDNNNLVRM